MPMPPARTGPSRRTTTGFGEATIRRWSSTIRRAPSAIPSPVASDRSAPEQNTRSAERISTTFTSSSRLRAVETGEQPADELPAQRVAVRRAVEGQRRDAVAPTS